MSRKIANKSKAMSTSPVVMVGKIIMSLDVAIGVELATHKMFDIVLEAL